MTDKIACFGIPSIFSFKSNVCGKCENFADCQKEAYQSLLAIREYPIATTMLVQHEQYRIASGQVLRGATAINTSKPIPIQQNGKVTRYALTPEQLERISILPKKIGIFLEKVWVRGLDKQISEDALNGRNPFSKNKARAYHAIYELLKQGRAHRSKMTNELIESLGWTYNSAYSQVSMIWQIFPELGIARQEDVFLVRCVPEDLNHNNKKLDKVIHEY